MKGPVLLRDGLHPAVESMCSSDIKNEILLYLHRDPVIFTKSAIALDVQVV